MRVWRLCLVFFLFCHQVQAQDSIRFFTPSKQLVSHRLELVISTESVLYAGSMVALSKAWYSSNKDTLGFHLFNDSEEWLQMDKLGHFTTSYYIGKLSVDALSWAGVPQKKALMYGAFTGLLYQTTIEFFDGFNDRWGFSNGDMFANTSGTFLLLTQGLLWNEQRIQPKVSYMPTRYPSYRPSVLGSNAYEALLKDYNGQTYWLSANISSFIPQCTVIPKWLNIAVGYGVDGLTGANINIIEHYNEPVFPTFERRRQFYVSLDADLTRINTKSHLLKALFSTIGFIKIPSPTWGITEGQSGRFYALFF